MSRIKPNFIVIKLDETKNWSDEIVDKSGGKVHGVYLYNESETTNLAELEPSYYLNHLYSFPEIVPENEKDKESLYEEIEEASNIIGAENNIYIHCHHLDSISESNKYMANKDYLFDSKEDYETEEALNELTEKVIEYYNCNHVF